MNNTVALFALRGLTRRPLQTALMLFALSVALASTMLMMAVLAGIREQIRRDLEQIGLDVVNVHLMPNTAALPLAALMSPLRARDLDWMRDLSGGGTVAPFEATMGVARADGASDTAQMLVLGTTADWGRIVPLKMIEGRFFKPGETGVGVLDEWVAKKLFHDRPATGQIVAVKQRGTETTLEVVGVMKDPFEIRKRFDELDVTGSARSHVLRMMEFKSIYVPGDFSRPDRPIHGAVVKVPAGTDPIVVSRAMFEHLGERKKSVVVWARREWIGNVLEFSDFGTQIANVLWMIVLFVTCIMIMTVSLIAIRERYREIAIRRTEGARRSQIVGQLLAENVLLSAMAGTTAIVLSRLGAAIIRSRYISWPPAFLPGDVALALGLGILLGTIATVLPAYRAASLDPVEVLRKG